MDLSTVSDEQLALILLKMPAKELITICTQVSKQWNRVLAEKFFWRDKMKLDGYQLEWPKLAGLSTKSFKAIAVHHSFGRNFIKDSWDLSVRDEGCLKFDPRWSRSKIVRLQRDGRGSRQARIEIPPTFLNGHPGMPSHLGEPIAACLATSFRPFTKHIVIKLADEGLTDEIMDDFRPTIVVSEMVANRSDCASRYQMKCSLKDKKPGRRPKFDFYPANDDEYREQQLHDNGPSVLIKLRYRQWQTEGWNKVEHVFNDYPSGMRYLTLQCIGSDCQFWAGYYGVKLANCSVKALCEKNAPE